MSTAEVPEIPDSTPESASCPFCGAAAGEGQAFCSACGQPGTPRPEGALLHGTYRIVSVLSTSSTGAVYQALDERRKRGVVLKELLAPPSSSALDRAALAKRFAQTVSVFEHLKHPSLPEVFGSFTQDGRLYLVMTLLPGQNLQAALYERGRGFSERQVRNWTRQLVGLLEYLEERHPPFVHGEILPSHVMLREGGVPVVIGYGLAPRLGLRPFLDLPGQPSASAPAKAAGRKRDRTGSANGKSLHDDLYGLGATLHSLLTGRDVFAGVDNPGRPFPSVRALAPDVSVGLAEIVNRSVATDQARRYPSAVATQAALTDLMGAAPNAPQRSAQAAPEAGRRGWWGLVAVAAVIVVAVALAAHSLLQPPSKTAVEPTPLPKATAVPTRVAPPPPLHTKSAAYDAFLRPSAAWPVGAKISRRNGELWVDNTGGKAPLVAADVTDRTGLDGFTLRATVRLAAGPTASTYYGIVALAQPGSAPSNVSLRVRGTGEWSLVRSAGGHVTTLVPWQQTTALRKGHNTPNQLQLSLVPGTGRQHGTFAVTINGRQMPVHAGAWAAAPTGEVGIEASPGARIACDNVVVGRIRSTPPIVDEHFIDNRLSWSSTGAAKSQPLLAGNVLRLHPAAGQVWAEATTSRYSTMQRAKSLTEEAAITVSSLAKGRSKGGVIFARTAAGSSAAGGAKRPPSVALAALLDTGAHLSVVELTPGHSKMLLGPRVTRFMRTGYGVNDLKVVMTRGSKSITVQISLNGSAPLTYTSDLPGIQPATGIAAIGKNAMVVASAFRLTD